MNDPTATGPSPWRRRGWIAGRWAVRVVVALTGALIAVLLFGHLSAPIGPFDATLAFRPFGGGAQVDVAPLGSIAVDVYDGPLHLQVDLARVDQDRARELASDPVRLNGVVDRVTEDLRSAVTRLIWLTAGVAVAGAAVTSLVVFRRRREPLIAGGLTLAVLAGTAGLGVLTWRPEAMTQPTYTGLLVNANSLIGNAEDIVKRFDAYRASLEDLVANVGTLYATLSALPAPGGDKDTVALLHVSDLHLNPAGFDLMRQVADQFQVDAVLDTGDLTDWGSRPENRLISAVGALDVPYVYVRGNHDSATTAALIAAQPNATVLDDSDTTVAGLVIAGTRDPRFTPDKTTGDDDAGAGVLTDSGQGLADFIATLDAPPAVAMVHDPKQAGPLDGEVPIVLAGHTHEREVSRLDGGTLLMVEGSTGGAGLRGLQGDYPEPLTCTVLYLDRDTGTLRAYDEVTLGGLGETEVTIQRRTVTDAPSPADVGTDGDAGGGADGTTGPGDGGTSEAPTSPTD